MPIPYLQPFTPEYLIRPQPQPKVRGDTYNTNAVGSSSTQGGQTECAGNGVTRSRSPMTWIQKWSHPSATKVFTNAGAGGTDTPEVEAAIAGLADKAGIIFIQADLQDGGINQTGGGHGRMAWLYNTIWDRDAGGASPLPNASVYTNRIWCTWVGTNGWQAGLIGWWNDSRFERLAWAEWPGLVINEIRYWQFAPSNGSATDDGDKAAMRQPTSMMIADRSHRHDRGYRFTAEAWHLDFWEACQGGLPFFADHRYDVTAGTCQTNGGAVVTLAFVGSLTGCTLQMLRADGSPHPDFAINSATAAITRATGTLITRPQDIFLRVQRGNDVKVYHLELNLSVLTTAPGMATLDGNFGLTLYSNDNAGSLYSPSYNDATSRLYSGVAGGQTEGAAIFCVRPDVNGTDMNIYNGGFFLRRLTTNVIRVTGQSDAFATFGQNSTSGVATVANGVIWCCFSFSCPNNRQQLVVWRDSDATVIGTGGVTTINSVTTGLLNPLAKNAGVYGFGARASGATNPWGSAWVGGYGPSWVGTKEIDWSNAANLALFRAGAGSFQDLGSNGAITIAAGVNAGVSVTPFDYMTGRPDELYRGYNRGTGGDWEPWQVRDWRRRNWLQGVPQ